jgi:SAM-dependent methyltransferase
MITDRRLVTIEETASILAVSPATVRNWIKHEYLRPAGGAGRLFRSDEVRALREGILSGSVPRLARRANKATASRSFIPDEYIDDGVSREAIEGAVGRVRAAGIDMAHALFMLALGRLHAAGMLGGGGAEGFLAAGGPDGREHLAREMREWHAELGGFRVTARHRALLAIDLPGQRDALGLAYQSLLLEGAKAAGGSYYTPDRIVKGIADDLYRPGARVLDPCCGTGQFLLAFAERTDDPETLHGTDIDPVAVRLARINLMMAFRDRDFAPRISRRNILLEGLPAGTAFDLVTTNPPWGLHYTGRELSRLGSLYPEIVSGESYSYILKRSIDLLDAHGTLSFLLPESILNVRAHADIRGHILKHARIERITRLGRVFKNVFTPVIRLDLSRGVKSAPSRSRAGAVDQERFLANGDFVFDINVNQDDGRILDRVYSCAHTTLEGKADWALGIVTGDNMRYLRPGCNRAGYEPIFTGKEVDHYLFRDPSSCIKFAPERFQQVAPEGKYRAPEKLVYRFISKRLVVAYDDRGRLTLNSANILIPRVERYPVKALLALLNSSLYQFLFQKKFSSIKVLRSHLERLPLPLWDADELDRLASIAGAIIAGKVGLREADDFIMERFGLSAAERAHIERSVS